MIVGGKSLVAAVSAPRYLAAIQILAMLCQAHWKTKFCSAHLGSVKRVKFWQQAQQRHQEHTPRISMSSSCSFSKGLW